MAALEQQLVDTQAKLLELYRQDIVRLQTLVEKQNDLIATYKKLDEAHENALAAVMFPQCSHSLAVMLYRHYRSKLESSGA